MFFLKSLPTDAMIGRFATQYAPGRAAQIGSTLQLLRDASQLIRQLDSFFARHDLSQLKFLILMVIDREPGRKALRFSDIAARIDVSRPVLSRTVNAMLDAGLLHEAPDEKDARVRHLSITPAGQSAFDALLPEYFVILTSTNLTGNRP